MAILMSKRVDSNNLNNHDSLAGTTQAWFTWLSTESQIITSSFFVSDSRPRWLTEDDGLSSSLEPNRLNLILFSPSLESCPLLWCWRVVVVVEGEWCWSSLWLTYESEIKSEGGNEDEETSSIWTSEASRLLLSILRDQCLLMSSQVFKLVHCPHIQSMIRGQDYSCVSFPIKDVSLSRKHEKQVSCLLLTQKL